MLKKQLLSLCLLVGFFAAYAKKNTNYLLKDSLSKQASNTDNPESSFFSKPTIGIGTGMLSFYGDLGKKRWQNTGIGRVGFDFTVSKYINPYFQLSFYTLFGKVGVNEKKSDNPRAANFESQIKLGGLQLLYNFGNLLPPERKISPYIFSGIESFEFLSKTDLKDKNGNTYHYWTDGSIRNLDQNDPLANTSIKLQRDYKYESDVRETNSDGFGKYKEQSLAIPFGFGVNMQLTDKCNLKIGTTMHFTFTDYVDGITSNSIGVRKGIKGNDKFMMTSFSLNFVLPSRDADSDKGYNSDKGDLLAYDMDDTDKDGVIDFKDSCAATPKGVNVDTKGCPLDDDNDAVPNYRDKELNTPKNVFVNKDGVQLSDSSILLQYLTYLDTGGMFAKTIYRGEHGSSGLGSRSKKTYSVQLGVFKGGIPSELVVKFLSIDNVKSTYVGDSMVVYTTGRYNYYQDADVRQKEIYESGIKDAKVVYKKRGKYIEEKNEDAAKLSGISTIKSASNQNVSGKPVFKVQLGAYSKKLSKDVFADVKDLNETYQNGLYKYSAGVFSTLEEAANYKVELLTKGYENTIIAAYIDDKRITLRSVGANFADKNTKESIEEITTPIRVVKKNSMVFKVQLGVFKSEVPAEALTKYKEVKGLVQEIGADGIIRFVIGDFNNYKDANSFKKEIIQKYNISDAFIVAKFNNKYIPLQEAMELIREENPEK